MTRSNREIVEAAYGRWNAVDFYGARALLHPEIEWRPSGQFPDFEPVYRGHEGIERFWRHMREVWSDFTIDIEQCLEYEGTVVIAAQLRAVGKGSGVAVELPIAHLWQLRDGLVVRYQAFRSLDEAVSAASAPPRPG